MTRLLAVLLLASASLAGAQSPDELLRAEMMFWESVRSSTDPADFRAYLEKYPNGNFAPLARNRLAALGAGQPAAVQPAVAAEKPTAEKRQAAGPPAAGDAWTYRAIDARSGKSLGMHEIRLVSAGAGPLVEEVLDQGATRRVEHRAGLYLLPVGKYTIFSPYLSQNLMQPGARLGGIDNFDARTCNAGWTCSLSARAVGWDQVRVPAGTFNAFKVEVYQSWSSPFQTNDRGETVQRTLTVWYSPETKRPVKFVSRGSPSANIDTEFELELVNYEVR